MKICLDPGHGGRDPGAIGPAGTKEAVINLAIAQKTARILRSAGIDTVLSRESDVEFGPNEMTDLRKRVETINATGADYVISIHADASTSPSANGCSFYTLPGQGLGDILATGIHDRVKESFPSLAIRTDYSDGDPDKEANYYVLRWTTASALLIECAFISNPQEEAMLNTTAFQENMALAIAKGIGDTIGKPVSPGSNQDAWAKEKQAIIEWGLLHGLINPKSDGDYEHAIVSLTILYRYHTKFKAVK
ncbi:N-acetylmuramoyl-L-alanine amidase family protein [Heliophilum fasciatum]|uniref:N-acetylmuramoyl-L-alanine amidase n=1 Tax=Heliophilum fasciatum TaxID=35700 RepID=A0A4R2S9B7_9FIRM|nr:N-acetylmuramoyl-L-alanine amidase [Heliophilum fasciatum]MCW2276606.1 N-acetylmuramoyl-L-alanine amidase [Heliophilum fasciatum]TCP69011.1 N-acetylmuramoyl-L-alanine amidase [Heliophilum fasciatum]